MSKMLAEISRIVNEDISNRVTQYDVLYESITNAIHANATEIVCKLKGFDATINDSESISEPYKRKVDCISISDNGDGLNEANYNSFCKYRSDFKKTLGGKGVGRFVFLKIFDKAEFVSYISDLNEKRHFSFNVEFDTEDIIKEPFSVENNFTEVSLSNLTKQYYDIVKGTDRRIELNLNEIRTKILTHLLPILFFYKKKGIYIVIRLIDESNEELTQEITKDDIPDFITKSFTVIDKDNSLHTFNLNYRVDNVDGKLSAYYCANSRTVCEFSDKDFNLSLPYGYSGFLLLESDYLSARANNERNDFDIFPKKTDMFATISWEMINSQLKKEISEIVKDGIVESKIINIEKLEEIQNERPYLMNYLDEEDIDIAGFVDKKQIIDKAKKKFDQAKESLLASANKSDYSILELQEAIQITQNELVSYIYDRALVLERLKILSDKKEKVESIIHNLFMEQRTQDRYYSVSKNNLWLIDDRFTSYAYAASEKRIKDILHEIGENDDDVEVPTDRPDLALFFSQNPETTKSLKSVLIEIKPFDFKSKSDRKKFAGVQQLVDYVKAFKTKENVEEIFAYLITDVDEKLAERLTNDDYRPLFSTDQPIYHRFYSTLGISIYVIGVKTLIEDALARNKVFLDIIKKQNRISKMFSKVDSFA